MIGRVIVALHLEDHRLAVADIDHAGVLSRPLDHLRPLGRQRAEPNLRGFVGAVLIPHGREDAKLGEAGRPAQQIENALIFIRLQPMIGGERLGDGRLGGRVLSGLVGQGRALRRQDPPRLKNRSRRRKSHSASRTRPRRRGAPRSRLIPVTRLQKYLIVCQRLNGGGRRRRGGRASEGGTGWTS